MRAKVQAYLFKRLGENRLFQDSENFRAKVEAKQLTDLGSTIYEKYGSNSGWVISLRNNIDFEKNINNTKPSPSDQFD